MKKHMKILGLLCITVMTVLSSHANTAVPFKITGELISIEPDVDGEFITSEQSTSKTPVHEPVDLSNATLTMSYEITNNKGEVETKVFHEGPYEEDFETFGALFEPFEIKISLRTTEDSDPMTINTVIGTGSDVHFAYIDHPARSDEFLVVGSSNQVLNPENKFSIRGDMNFLEVDSLLTTSAYVYASFVDLEGNPQSKQWGPVLLKDGSFVIEGDIERPIQARLFVLGGYNTSTQIVIEPQGKLEVTKLGDQTQAIGVTGVGYHEILIDSWQQTEEYIELVEAYVIEYEKFHNPSTSTAATNESDDEFKEDSSNEETDTDEDSDEESIDMANVSKTIQPAEGCEDTVVQEDVTAVAEAETTSSTPRWLILRGETWSFQAEKLQDIAMNHTDPHAQLLAMQMDAFSPYVNAKEALSVYRTLSDKFDEDFVDTFITPELERIERIHTFTLNDEALVPGQRVPAFTLANLDGEDVSIYDLASEKDMVLIDFWASWCGPCIATFPELKKLYTAYTDENFEIVGVSIDSNLEAWSGGVEEHELPWVQLGELKDTDNGSPVAKSYGVNFIPKTYLIDSQGCIYRKDIHPDELKKFLVDRYGMDESLGEPEEESEDTPDVSG